MRKELTSFDRKWIRRAKAVIKAGATDILGLSVTEARGILREFGIKQPKAKE